MLKKILKIKEKKTRIILFFYSIFILIAFVAVDKIFFYNNIQILIVENGKNQIDEREEILKRFINKSVVVLENLRATNVFNEFLDNTNEKNLNHLKKMFLLISNTHSNFMQLRYIDKFGNEIIRVDRKEENGKVFESNNLQNKASRYYFSESKKRELEKVWFSNLDLNIEGKKVEKPYKPTLRAILPIKHNDSFRGIIIINFFMNDFLKAFDDITLYNMILVDKKGNTLVHYDSEKSWGLYKEEKFNIKSEFDNYKTILEKDIYTSEEFISKKLDVSIDNMPILILKPKKEYLEKLYSNQNIQYLFTILIVLLLTYLVSFFILRALKNLYFDLSITKKLNKKLDRLNEKFTTILNTTNDMVLIINEYKVIEFSNRAFLELTGFSETEVLRKEINEFLKEKSEEFLEKFELSLNNEAQKFEYSFLSKDNRNKTLLISLIKIKKQNKVLLIAKDITEIKEQQELFIQQSKLASMGEMLSNIAHQWRQPLNILNLTAVDLKYKYEYGELDKQKVEEISLKLQNQIEYLSQTIDDFRDFFTPNKKKELFKISEAVSSTLNIIGSSLKENFIDIELELDESVEINSYKNQLEQVLINILNNAKDALVLNKIKEPHIKIKVYNDKKNIIEISNNGGAIKEEIINKIFEPYFSTKFSSKGTGLGLYMSKTIIEKNMGGNLRVDSKEENTTFIISFES